MANTKIINGKKYIVSDFGKITYYVNQINGRLSFSFSLGETVGTNPFGLSLICDLSTTQASLFGYGAILSSKLTFQTSGTSIITTDYYGTTNTYAELSESETFNEIEYSHKCNQNGLYLREDEVNYYFRDNDGNITTITKSASGAIIDYTAVNGSGYAYDAETLSYVSKDGNSSIELIKNIDGYVSNVVVYEHEGTSKTAFLQVDLEYDLNTQTISRISYYKRANLIEDYQLSKYTEGNYIIYKLRDVTRKCYISFNNLQGGEPQLEIKTRSDNNDSYGPTLILKYKSSYNYTLISGNDGNKIEYHYDVYGNASYDIDSKGNAIEYKFDSYKRLVYESKPIYIFNNDDNLNNNHDFSNGIVGYEGTGYYAYSSSIPTLETIVSDRFSGSWVVLNNTSLNESTLSKTINVHGYQGEQYSASVFCYVQSFLTSSHFRILIQYLKSGVVVNGEYYAKILKSGTYETIIVTGISNGEFDQIKITLVTINDCVLRIKEIGLYHISLGKEIVYGEGGRVIEEKSGFETISINYDSSLHFKGFVKDDLESDELYYDDYGRPYRSVDIYGNVTELEYDNNNELTNQEININGKQLVTSQTIRRVVSSNTKIVEATNEQEKVTTTKYDYKGEQTFEITDSIGKYHIHSYNTYQDLVKIKTTYNSVSQENTINYRSDRLVNTVRTPLGSYYRFGYNTIGDITKVCYSTTTPLVSYQYDDGDTSSYLGRVTRVLYGNKDAYKFSYLSDGRVNQISYLSSSSATPTTKFTYSYDSKNRLSHVETYDLQSIARYYFYDEENRIKRIELNQGSEVINTIYDKKGKGYISYERDYNHEESVEMINNYDKRKIYSPNQVTTFVSNRFYSTYFTYASGHESIYLQKYLSSGKIDKIVGEGSLNEVKLLSLTCTKVTIDSQVLKYTIDNSNKTVRIGFLYKSERDNTYVLDIGEIYYVDSQNIEHHYILRRNNDDIDLVYVTKDGATYYDHGIITIVVNGFETGWNFISLSIEKISNILRFTLVANNNESIRDDNEIQDCYIDSNVKTIYIGGSKRGVESSQLTVSNDYFSGILYSYEMSMDEVRQYRDVVTHHIIDTIKYQDTWNQEVSFNKVFYNDFKQSGLTNIEYAPLSGDFVTSLRNYPAITYRNSVAKLSNTPFIYDEQIKRKVFDANKFGEVKYLTNFSSSATNYTFKIKYRILGGAVNNNTLIVTFKDLRVAANINNNTFKLIIVDTSSQAVTTFNYDYNLSSWYDLFISISSSGVTLTQGGQTFTYSLSGLLANDEIILGQHPKILYSELIYGEGVLSNIDYLTPMIQEVKSDTADRLLSIDLTSVNNHQGVNILRSFTYQDIDQVKTTRLINKEDFTINGTLKIRNQYSYDDLGRLRTKLMTRVGVGTIISRFDYDNYGYLSHEEYGLYERNYSYDVNGNILSVTYSDGDTSLITKSYTYDSTYCDRLKKVIDNGVTTTLIYDTSDPYRLLSRTNSQETISYTYEGRRLTTISNNKGVHRYVYDDQGLRLGKIANENSSNVYYYFNYLGDKLISESVDNDKLRYFYGLDDKLLGFEYISNGVKSKYYYIWDITNIVGIVDKSGNIVVEYHYDGYGNILSIDGTLASTIGTINPFKYKGYYYDNESGLYFADGRYYDPTLGRFIVAGNVDNLDPSSINGLNLFVYADNCPVMVMHSTAEFDVYGQGSKKNKFNLPKLPWIVEQSTFIISYVKSFYQGVPIVAHYFKYGRIIKNEFKLYGISVLKTSNQLADINWKIVKLDVAFIFIDMVLDAYDSYQRGVSIEGILLGMALTVAKDVALIFATKGIMWLATTIGTAILPGVGTGVGFVIGLILSIAADYHIGSWIDKLIDYIAK